MSRRRFALFLLLALVVAVFAAVLDRGDSPEYVALTRFAGERMLPGGPGGYAEELADAFRDLGIYADPAPPNLWERLLEKIGLGPPPSPWSILAPEAIHWTVGPNPSRDREEWLDLLNSDRPAEILAALTWLGGVHLDLEKPAPGTWHEEPETARLWDGMLSDEGVKRRLAELSESAEHWIREAARLATERETYSPPR